MFLKLQSVLHFGVLHSTILKPVKYLQASLYFQWLKWIFSTIGSTRDIFVVNMDETSIQNEYACRKGYVIEMDQDERVEANCFYQRIDMSSTRTHSTLVGLIALNKEVQHLLPQVFLPNWSKITMAEKQAYVDGLQPPIEVWKGFNGWVTSEAMTQLITRYRYAVNHIKPGSTLVLLMDAASQHLSKEVLMHARRMNVMLVTIPGKLTYLLQPLDVSVFRVLKDCIKKKLLHARMADDDGVVNQTTRIEALNAAIHEVLIQKDWSSAFQRVGATGDFSTMRKSIMYYFPQGIHVEPNALNDEELEEMAGRHRLDLAMAFNSVPERLMARSLADSQESAVDMIMPGAPTTDILQRAPPRIAALPLPPRNPYIMSPARMHHEQ